MKSAPFPCFILVLILMLFARSARAQNTESRDTADYPYWMEMMQDRNVPFHSTQSAFYKYWKNRDTEEKGKGYKVFKRWEYINQQRIGPDGLRQPASYVPDVYEAYQKAASDRSSNGNWTLLGPSAYPTNSTSQPTGMGRVNAIAFHPTDANTLYIGAPNGGFWKTTDNGATWTNLSNDLPTLGISSIVIHPGNPNIIYLGTGDRDSDDAPAKGVYKSTDGGATWAASNTGMDANTIVGDLLMNPMNNNSMLAGTNTGLYRSYNGGANWVKKLSGNVWKDLEYKPGDTLIVYGAYGGSLYRSTNGGVNWSNVVLPVTGNRIVLGVTAADPTYLYILQTNSSGGFAAMLRSTDSGASFSTMSTPASPPTASMPNILAYQCTGNDLGGQAGYDLCIHVDPSDKNLVITGGVNLWKSTNGGVNWTITSHWVGATYGTSCAASVHADQHVLVRSPLNGYLYAGHDGGIHYSTNDGSTWTEISSGLSISQIYKISQSATNSALTLSGYQDNGSSLRNNSSITTVRGGDGMECVIDYNNTNYRYTSSPNGGIFRTTSGGNSYSRIGGKTYNGIDEDGAWVTPYSLHKTNTSVMFAGYKNMWRTDNVQTAVNTDVLWSKISSGETTNCIAVEQSTADPNIVYVVRSGQIKRSDNANDTPASVAWTTCNLPGTSYTPTDLKTHPTNANIVYASANYGVYKSTDKGITWTDISGSLPALYTNCLVYDKNSNEGLYVGNQTGVWYRDNTLPDWINFSSGLPLVDVRELEIYAAADPVNSRLMAATYGRGLWQSDLYLTVLPVELVYFQALCRNGSVEVEWTTASEVDNELFSIERSIDGRNWTGIAMMQGSGNSGTTQNYKITDADPDPAGAYYRLKQTDSDGAFTYSRISYTDCSSADPEKVRIYPNPTGTDVRVEGFDGSCCLTVLNATGTVVYKMENLEAGALVPLASLPGGMYTFKLSAPNFNVVKNIHKL